MSSPKDRLSATVDAELLAIGRAAVAEGRAESISAWVNEALLLKADHDERLAALDVFLDAYESAHGEITEDEIQQATRATRSRALVVRTPAKTTTRNPRRRGAA